MKRTGDIAAKPIEKSEIIRALNAKRVRRRSPLAFFRQEATEVRAALTT